MPCAFAAANTGAARSRLSSIEQLMLRRENDSLAATNTAISSARAASAPSKPFMFGTRTGYATPGLRRMRAITSATSARGGTHLGDTKDVASTAAKPASDNMSMSRTLPSVATTAFSFCRPSRGPTSTRRTRAGSADAAIALARRRVEIDEIGAFGDALADAAVDGAHRAVVRRDDRVLHLHRLEHDERRGLRDRVARLCHHRDDRAGHRRAQVSVAVVGLFVHGERVGATKHVVRAVDEHVPLVAARDHRRDATHAVHVERDALAAGADDGHLVRAPVDPCLGVPIVLRRERDVAMAVAFTVCERDAPTGAVRPPGVAGVPRRMNVGIERLVPWPMPFCDRGGEPREARVGPRREQRLLVTVDEAGIDRFL